MYEHEISITKIAPYIRFVNDVTFKSGFRAGERIIYDHEFIFGLSGETRLKYDGEEYCIRKSDIFYLKPNIKNEMYIEDGKSFRAHCVHFDWAPLDEQYNFSAEQYYLSLNFSPAEREKIEKLKIRPNYEVPAFYIQTLINNLDYEILAPMFIEMYHCFLKTDVYSRLRERALFIQIVAEVIAQQLTEHGVLKNHFHQKTISQAIQYMKVHYAEEINTPFLAKQFGLSPKYFGVLFKSVTGLGIHEYLLDIRMQKARNLLIGSQIPIDEIAEGVGVRDAFYFNKLFKKHEGITPGKYRKMLSN